MIQKIYIYNPYTNQTVTSKYVNNIKRAIELSNICTEKIEHLTKQERSANKGIVVVSVNDAIKAKRMGYYPVITWVQGIVPEESFMRNKSKFRSFLLSKIEKIGLKSSDFLFYVSEAMKEHYEKKYRFKTNECYVMPCFNDEMRVESFKSKKKYENNIFLYAGSVEPWQCFSETLSLFKQIEDRVPNAMLRIMTSNQEEAKKQAKEIGIKNYFVGFAPGDQIVEEMARAKFGFSLRKDHPVNNVSTPTKLSTYVANGVIPIYSKYVKDFYKKSEDNPFSIQADENNDYGIEQIVSLCNSKISKDCVFKCFNKSYGDYYSNDFHVNNITKIFSFKFMQEDL